MMTLLLVVICRVFVNI